MSELLTKRIPIGSVKFLAVNHPGATGSIASRIAADAPPDGYTGRDYGHAQRPTAWLGM